jgi:hypothetical protein
MVAPIRFIENQKHVASRRGHSYLMPTHDQNENIEYEDEINQTYDSGDDKRVTAIADGKGQESDEEFVNDVQRDSTNRKKLVASVTTTEQEYESELKPKEKVSKFIILPHSKFRSSWDIFVGILLLYVATFLPYQVSFFNQDYGGVIKDFEIFIDTSFGVDIVLNFLTGKRR